jgi:lipopolysaccharide/colanic/teichoic acid biosynthesis glycosyltransferase
MIVIRESLGEDGIIVGKSIHKKTGYLFTKRCFDIFFAFVFGIILLIPMAFIGVLIRIDSKGPIIFRQERLGQYGKPFIIYKFRSMRIDAEENGPVWAEKDDDRCTRVGRILRRTRLDELPQLWNIFKGEMSFVGPRPEREYFYNKFEKTIPDFRKRLLIKPGLTGHAQVNGGLYLTSEEKIIYDMEYMENQTIIMDLKCILKTLLTICKE